MIAYRLLLRLCYPRAFRRRYEGEMVEDFLRLRARVRAERGQAGVVWLWARTVADALVSGTTTRLRGTIPDDEEGRMRKVLFHFQQALAGLRRTPGYAAAFTVTLGLAIGANSAMFSVVHGVLLEPLPFPDGDRTLYLKQPVAAGGVENARFSFMEIDDYRAASTTVDEFVEYGDWEFTVLGDGEPHRAVGGLVTSNYFEVMGMRPALGRILNAEDDRRGAEPVMVLTHAYWDRVYGRDPEQVGRVVDLENLTEQITLAFRPARIVGVLEPGPHYTSSRQPDFYVNYATNDHYQSAAMRDARDHRMTDVFARLAPGASVAAARSELRSLAAEFRREYPEAYDPELGYGLEVVPWQEELTRQGRPTFLLLMGTVGLILLLAAANVTNLTLTRLIRKEEELVTRAALGASRTDLRLHLTAENLLLGLAGGSLGVLLAMASRDSLAAYASRFTVRAQEVGVDWTVLGLTLGGAVVVAVSLAWLPWLPVAPGPADAASARSRATASRGRKRVQRGLVVTQLAMSFALLAGAGLLVRSMLELSAVDPGFTTERILTLQAPTGPMGLPIPGSADPGWEEAVREIREFPGVRAAAVASEAPLSGGDPGRVHLGIDDGEPDRDAAWVTAVNHVSPGYFDVLGLVPLAGRVLEATDGPESPRVAVVNRSFARAHFGDDDPVGHRITLVPDYQTVFVEGTWEIVGVVPDTREHGMDARGIHAIYLPASRTSWGPAVLVASEGDMAALTEHVRRVIHRMDPARAVEDVRTLKSLVDREMAPSRLNAVLVGGFALLALLIAAVGVMGALAFSVSQRIHEFGIRMALGAAPRGLLRNVLGEGVVLVVAALVLGTGAALVLGRFLSGLLFGVEPVDPLSLAAAGAILAAVALAASLVPALRATRIRPAEALGAE